MGPENASADQWLEVTVAPVRRHSASLDLSQKAVSPVEVCSVCSPWPNIHPGPWWSQHETLGDIRVKKVPAGMGSSSQDAAVSLFVEFSGPCPWWVRVQLAAVLEILPAILHLLPTPALHWCFTETSDGISVDLYS